jgi:hypothetical protein
MMPLTIHIRELKDRLHELDTAMGEVIITSDTEVIARLTPKPNVAPAPPVPLEERWRPDPFAEWTAEDTRRAKESLKRSRYRFTTEQVIACVRALEES